MVDQLASRNERVTWARPPVKEFSLLQQILGAEIDDAVFEGKNPKQALRDAENTILRAMNAR